MFPAVDNRLVTANGENMHSQEALLLQDPVALQKACLAHVNWVGARSLSDTKKPGAVSRCNDGLSKSS